MNRGNLFNLFYHFRTLQSGRMINYREEEKRILDEILGKGVYDNRIRPSGTNGTGQTWDLIEFLNSWLWSNHKMSNLAKSKLIRTALLKLLDHKLSVSQTISNNYNQCNKWRHFSPKSSHSTLVHCRWRHSDHGQPVHPQLRQDRWREDGVQRADHLQAEVVRWQAHLQAQTHRRHAEWVRVLNFNTTLYPQALPYQNFEIDSGVYLS